jgi:uncharacterized protein (DUF2062 family)
MAARDLGYEALLTIDADGQHDPADARQLLEAATLRWPAVVIGARRMEEAAAPRASVFGRDFSNFWVRLECGETVPDTQSGYRLYPVDFLISEDFLSRRYTFEVEVLVRAVWAGLPIISVPISVLYPAGKERVSHFCRLRDNLRLSCLHTWLVLRSLLPWPHRRLCAVTPAASAAPGQSRPWSFLHDLCREHATAGELAAAVWVGIFIGALPIIPFGIAAIIYVNQRLHLNKLAGVGASNVCCAPFVPLLCAEVGHFMLHGRFWTDFNRQTLVAELPQRLWEWLLGSMVVGPLLGCLGAGIVYVLVGRLRARQVAG